MRFVTRIILTYILMHVPANAEECGQATGSGDGVPVEFYQLECLANNLFRDKKYSEAASYYEKASSLVFFEAPNYSLRLEWAESLCLAGRKVKGKRILESYELMAKADLGEFECPESQEEFINAMKYEYMEIACQNYGTVLSKPGKEDLKKRMLQIPRIQHICR